MDCAANSITKTVKFLGGCYNIDTSLILTDTHSGISLISDNNQGAFIETNNAITLLHIGEDLSGGGDTVGSTYISNVQIRNLTFRSISNTAINIGIKISKASYSIIQNCQFSNLDIAIDGHRYAYSILSDCFFKMTNRTSAKSFIRLNGVYDSTESWTPGGNLFFSNLNFIGRDGAGTSPISAINIKTVDGIYITQMHSQFCKYSILISPEDNNWNNNITDVKVQNSYFDDPEENGANVFLSGTKRVGNYYKNIGFHNCYFRGANKSYYGLQIDVADAGSAPDIENIVLESCNIRQHKKNNIAVAGPESSKLTVDRLMVNGCSFSDGNYEGTNNVDTLSFDGKHLTFNDNIVNSPTNLGILWSLLINTTISGASTMISNNDFSDSGRTTDDAIRVNMPNGSQQLIENNLGINFEESGISNIVDGTAIIIFQNGSFPSTEYVILLQSGSSEILSWNSITTSGFGIQSSVPNSESTIR